MTRNRATRDSGEKKTIVVCEKCYQKLRIPRRKRKLLVTCTLCRNEFDYRYYGFGLSSGSKKPALVGLTGSLVAIPIIELIIASQILSAASCLLNTMVLMGVFGTCLGAAMGAASGFFGKDRDTLQAGLTIGAIAGLLCGTLSGLIAQLVFSGTLVYVSLDPYTCLWSGAPRLGSSLASKMLARSLGWSAFGALIGLLGGIREQKLGDVKSGLIGGAAGGGAAGFLFDIPGSFIGMGEGALGRLLGFSVLGTAIGVVLFRFRKITAQQRRDLRESQQIAKEILAGPGLFFLGVALFIAGLVLYGGNTTGAFPTFPFAGFITGTIGLAIVGAALKRR